MRQGAALAALTALGLLLAGAPAPGQDRDRAQTQQQVRDRDIYGYQLMAPEEREEYRERMRSANSFEERERIRSEHRARMQERAQERGLALPDEPRYRGTDTRDRGRMREPGMGGPGAGGGPDTGRGAR